MILIYICLQAFNQKEDITYLESVSTALDIALSEEDLAEIKEELIHSLYGRSFIFLDRERG